MNPINAVNNGNMKTAAGVIRNPWVSFVKRKKAGTRTKESRAKRKSSLTNNLILPCCLPAQAAPRAEPARKAVIMIPIC